MNRARLGSTLIQDIRLQFRNGFYYASAFVAVMLVLLLLQFRGVDLRPWWPVIILENLVINAFYFMAGMVLLEKGEGTLEALVVTPLRDGEYLTAKVLSLLLLSIFETLLVVVIIQGLSFNPLWLVLGLALLIGFFSLYGFFVVARYDSISEFLMPSILWTFAYSLPLLHYLNLWRSPLMFLHPIMPPLVLIEGAFQPVPQWQIIYGLAAGAAWVGLAFMISRRAFYRFVIRKEGVK
jgi:fluoroquinolone transport system permease protein